MIIREVQFGKMAIEIVYQLKPMLRTAGKPRLGDIKRDSVSGSEMADQIRELLDFGIDEPRAPPCPECGWEGRADKLTCIACGARPTLMRNQMFGEFPPVGAAHAYCCPCPCMCPPPP